MNYIDIEQSLLHFKNYQIPEIPKIITNYVIRNPDKHSIFKSKYKNIDRLLNYIYQLFDADKTYTEEVLLQYILDYFEIPKERNGINDG